eukprot:698648-Rhodomonas_salina.3
MLSAPSSVFLAPVHDPPACRLPSRDPRLPPCRGTLRLAFLSHPSLLHPPSPPQSLTTLHLCSYTAFPASVLDSLSVTVSAGCLTSDSKGRKARLQVTGKETRGKSLGGVPQEHCSELTTGRGSSGGLGRAPLCLCLPAGGKISSREDSRESEEERSGRGRREEGRVRSRRVQRVRQKKAERRGVSKEGGPQLKLVSVGQWNSLSAAA